MKILTYLKIFVLVAALGLVIYVMTHLSPDRVSKSLEQAGLTPAVSSGVLTSGQVDLCPTRVHAIVWPDGRKIQEVTGGMKAKWQAYNLDPVDIGSMDVEKWLSLHCQVPVSYLNASTANPAMKVALTFDYIDGRQEKLEQADGSLYRFKDRTFSSPELSQAISDLISLANLKPQGP